MASLQVSFETPGLPNSIFLAEGQIQRYLKNEIEMET